MCSHLIMNDKSNAHLTSASRLSTFNSFDKVNNYSKDLTPNKKSRELSPRRSSFSKLEPNRYDVVNDL